MRSQKLLKNSLLGCLFLTLSFGSIASDSDRITQLEKEVQELKNRLTTLESPVNKAIVKKSTVTSDGWKNLANWRSLKKGMSFDEVRAILGEPGRIQGGTLTDWTYPDQASVTFYNDRLHRWSEPR
jgi:hypothetical protein